MPIFFKRRKQQLPQTIRQLPFMAHFSAYADRHLKNLAETLNIYDRSLSPKRRKTYFFLLMGLMTLLALSLLSRAIWNADSKSTPLKAGSITPPASGRLPDSLNIELLKVMTDSLSDSLHHK
jgi:hypothetical protein